MSRANCGHAAFFKCATFRFFCRILSIATKVVITTCSSRSRCVLRDNGFPAQEARGDRNQGAATRLYRASSGGFDREGAVGRTLGSRDQFDGYRVQVYLANQEIKVFTRRGHDWTKRFRKVADDAWHLAAGSAIIDAEVVAPAADGTTDFSVLQKELKGTSTRIV
jgi:hypothetical protein